MLHAKDCCQTHVFYLFIRATWTIEAIQYFPYYRRGRPNRINRFKNFVTIVTIGATRTIIWKPGFNGRQKKRVV